MNVVIVGAGEVGFHIADRLSREKHNVTIIEKSGAKERQIRGRVDALVVRGNGASTRVLEQVEITRADLFIAVTDLDEVNLISCLLASDFKVPRVIARIKSIEYTRAEWLRNAEKLGVDLIINPESVVADEICNAVSYNLATEVAEFADGRVVFLGYPIGPRSPLAGVSLRTLGEIRGIYRMVVTAITRGSRTIIPSGDDVFEEGDVAYFCCEKRHLPAVSDLFGFEKRETRSIFILGGSRTGLAVARRLSELKFRLKLIDRNPQRCEEIARELETVHVLNAAGTDVETLKNEGIEEGDVFIAVTDDDKTNILCSLLAKRWGVKRAIANVDQHEFLTLAPSLGVDACISPRLATASAILKYVRGGGVVSMAVLDQSDSEVIEFVLPPDRPILNKPLKQLTMPKGFVIGAIVRGDGVIVPGGDDHLEAGDHVVIFTLPDAILHVEKYFS